MERISPLPLVITSTALAELEAIWQYSAQTWGFAHADRYLSDLNKSFALLCDMPEIAPIRTEFTNPTRVYRAAEHLMFYRVEDEALRILRVVHARQNWQRLFDAN
ncbi:MULTISPECIES: type II toxin-antitoxin system RelE/ParE family toxin [unclassified Marinovum]